MNTIPKTIQIYLPGGDPRGIRVAEVTTRIVQVIEVPRSLLKDFIEMPESNQVGVYFLFGEEEDGPEKRVYIGQTGDLRERLKTWNKEKDFWQHALVLMSRTNSLTQTHALFLEWHSLQEAKKAGRYAAENGNSGSKPHTPAPLKADCLEIFETGQVLLATLGYPLFEPLVKSETSDEQNDIFFCKRSGADGRGQYTSEGFVVLKGSTGRAQLVPSAIGKFADTRRQELLSSGVIRIDGDKVVFEKDWLFETPSGAASTLTGAPANGWDEWIDANNMSLDDRFR